MNDIFSYSVATVGGAGVHAINSELFGISKPKAVFAYQVGVNAAAIPITLVACALTPPEAQYGIPIYIFVPLVLTSALTGMHKSGNAVAKWYCNSEVTLEDSLKLGAVAVVEVIALAVIITAGPSLIGS